MSVANNSWRAPSTKWSRDLLVRFSLNLDSTVNTTEFFPLVTQRSKLQCLEQYYTPIIAWGLSAQLQTNILGGPRVLMG